MREHEIEKAARRLGNEAAERLDTERVAARVLDRLRAGERIPAPRPTRWWIAAAAALAIVLGSGTLILRTDPAPAGGEQMATTPLLDLLSADELGEVLDSLSVQLPVSELGSGLDHLDAAQLEELLATMEG